MNSIKKIRYWTTTLVFFTVIAICNSETRPSWESVTAPEILSIKPDTSDAKTLEISFNLLTATDGADKAIVELIDENGKTLLSKNIGKSKKLVKTAKLQLEKSGNYRVKISALRNGEDKAIVSTSNSFFFAYPLVKPELSARNVGKGNVVISWQQVLEAESYEVKYWSDRNKEITRTTDQTEIQVSNLSPNTKYSIIVSAVREKEKSESSVLKKTVLLEADRLWQFTWFGQSSNGSRNTMEMIDSDDLKFNLNSCTFNEKTLDIIDKGGKFTTFHDGISYYYTVIDPEKENFSLSATFTVNYINNPADGQEGFGLLAMDSLGENGVSMTNHYTNSAGIIATKFEETIGGTKKTSKDTLGARFVSGLTPEILSQGEASIAQNGKSVSHAFSYDAADLVHNGDTYRITLKKTNTGYHAIYEQLYSTEDFINEYVLYGTEKLQQLDKEHIYLGFAVARGCNVTVSDVNLTITNTKTDAPAQKEPAELIPLVVKVDSPSSYYDADYPFVFNANSDGKLSVFDSDRKEVINKVSITAEKDYSAKIKLVRGVNDYSVVFTPDKTFSPGENQALAHYDRDLKRYVEGISTVTLTHMIVYNTYDVKELYVAPDGSPFGKGTKSSPLDLQSALGYSKPGQTVVLKSGVYRQSKALIIERGNNGSRTVRKILKSEDGGRAILDFANAKGGFQLWGDWWEISNIDVCNTDGNVKGLQIAGDNNVINCVNTYNCGDTGCQISGTSTEPFEKWPTNNLIKNCTSYGNCDPAENNADGFAAKLTCGEGNRFYGCIAYNNIDDGWDLFAKAESGPIGIVTIENCCAFRNGFLMDGSGNGDGNGFKLGGDGIGIAHVLKNSYAWDNGATGVTSNSNPDIVLENVTVFANRVRNIALYGKGDASRNFKATGVISIDGAESDNISEMASLISDSNYFWTGATCENKTGKKLSKANFISCDINAIPDRKIDGTINMKGFLQKK